MKLAEKRKFVSAYGTPVRRIKDQHYGAPAKLGKRHSLVGCARQRELWRWCACLQCFHDYYLTWNPVENFRLAPVFEAVQRMWNEQGRESIGYWNIEISPLPFSTADVTARYLSGPIPHRGASYVPCWISPCHLS